MAFAPQNDSSNVTASANRSNSSFTKELVGCRVIRNERDWKWSKQVSNITTYLYRSRVWHYFY